jgi:hypothetical protein
MTMKRRLTMCATLAAGSIMAAGTLTVVGPAPASAATADCEKLAATRDYTWGMYNWYKTFGPHMGGWSELIGQMYATQSGEAASDYLMQNCKG